MTKNLTSQTIVKAGAKADTTVQSDISRVALFTTGASAALIGLWAVTCFASALVTSGPVELLKGFASALLGAM